MMKLHSIQRRSIRSALKGRVTTCLFSRSSKRGPVMGQLLEREKEMNMNLLRVLRLTIPGAFLVLLGFFLAGSDTPVLGLKPIQAAAAPAASPASPAAA